MAVGRADYYYFHIPLGFSSDEEAYQWSYSDVNQQRRAYWSKPHFIPPLNYDGKPPLHLIQLSIYM